jgi:nucleoside-diphosphate-sugar epimerase
MSEQHVIFGTGPLGKWTARALLEMGHAVRMINRSGKADRLPREVEVIAGDAYNLEKNIELTRDAVAIYQCAQPHYFEWVEKFPPMQQAILEAAVTNETKLVVGDNLYMYGHFQGALTEETPVAPNSRKGRVRAEMAQEILDAHTKGKVRAVIGRGSDFFGPDDFALTSYAIQPAVHGKTVNLIGRTDMAHTYTYIADFGRLLATLGTRADALGQIWFAPSPPPITQEDLIQMIETELGQSIKTMVAGPLMMRFLGLFNRNIREAVEMMFEWMHPYVVDTTKAQDAFGLQPTPFSKSIPATLDWLKSL